MKFLLFSMTASIVIVIAALMLKPQTILSPIEKLYPTPTPTVLPLLPYQVTELSKRATPSATIRIDELEDDAVEPDTYRVRTISFKTGNKKVSGRITYPLEPGTYPLVFMIRGYVDREIYYTGIGSERAANYLAEHGYVTLAADFLGYGASDAGSADGLEDRFQTYTTFIDLMREADRLDTSFSEADLSDYHIDQTKRAIWAHSNGGQIALTALAATELPYPTVLWAPVTKPFPYNVLFYSDEAADEGKALRKLIADFEQQYDVRKYSFTDYLDRIKALIRIHQGTADEAIPVPWTQLITANLEEAGVDVESTYYEGENHNFNLGSWNDTMEATEAFYKSEFEK